jgi:hypothetical protein
VDEVAAWEHCMETCEYNAVGHDNAHLEECHRDYYYPEQAYVFCEYTVMYDDVTDIYIRAFAGRMKAFAMGLCSSDSNPLSRMRRHPWFDPQLLSLLCR